MQALKTGATFLAIGFFIWMLWPNLTIPPKFVLSEKKMLRISEMVAKYEKKCGVPPWINIKPNPKVENTCDGTIPYVKRFESIGDGSGDFIGGSDGYGNPFVFDIGPQNYEIISYGKDGLPRGEFDTVYSSKTNTFSYIKEWSIIGRINDGKFNFGCGRSEDQSSELGLSIGKFSRQEKGQNWKFFAKFNIIGPKKEVLNLNPNVFSDYKSLKKLKTTNEFVILVYFVNRSDPTKLVSIPECAKKIIQHSKWPNFDIGDGKRRGPVEMRKAILNEIEIQNKTGKDILSLDNLNILKSDVLSDERELLHKTKVEDIGNP